MTSSRSLGHAAAPFRPPHGRHNPGHDRRRDDALFRPEVREAFAKLGAQGWTNAVRKMRPKERVYVANAV